MNEMFLKEILHEYDIAQNEERQALEERRKEVLDKIPEISHIHTKMVELMAEQSRQIIQQPEKSSETVHWLQKEIAALKGKEMELLSLHGHPSDYLELRYRCIQCKDTGYTGFPVREKCNCLIQKLLTRTYQLSNINELDYQNFGTFDPLVFPDIPLQESRLSQREYMIELRDRMQDYVSLFPNNERKSILFTGKTGLGKTFLLNCMAKAILDKGYTVIRISAYKLFDQLFYSGFSDQSAFNNLQRRLFEVHVLIIDDLGTETRRNNYTTEDLFNIFNERSILGVHTFLSTNLGLSDLRQRYSDRITSRLFDTSNTMIIGFRGQDIRLRPTPKA